MRFALFGNTYETYKSVYAEQLFAVLSKHHAEVYVEKDFYDFISQSQTKNIPFHIFVLLPGQSDVAASF